MGENFQKGLACSDGYPMVELDSDDDCRAESSEDELDVILHGTPDQKRRLRRHSLGLKSSSSEDEFEKEMSQELNKTMENLKATQSAGGSQDVQSSTGNPPSSRNTFYDASYFDSDSDEEGTSQAKSSQKHPVISNDDLFYDPDIDDNNQLWVNRQRQQYQPKSRKRRSGEPNGQKPQRAKPLPHSDAVLNCPACMTVLCLDCQRHAVYKNQYRAMFVMNCSINSEEVLQFPAESSKKSKKNLKKLKKQKKKNTANVPESENSDLLVTQSSSDSLNPAAASSTGTTADTAEPMDTDSDAFNPVMCTICTTEVGVYDKDEVYHFFNVLASYA